MTREIDFTHDLTTSDGQIIGSVDLVVGISTGFGGWQIDALYREERKTTWVGKQCITVKRLIELPASDPMVKALIEQINASDAFAREVEDALEMEAA